MFDFPPQATTKPVVALRRMHHNTPIINRGSRSGFGTYLGPFSERSKESRASTLLKPPRVPGPPQNKHKPKIPIKMMAKRHGFSVHPLHRIEPDELERYHQMRWICEEKILNRIVI
jgi:hypothetical protein